MESYIACFFSTEECALASARALVELTPNGLLVVSMALCRLAPEGDLVAQPVDSRFEAIVDRKRLPRTEAHEAFELLDELLPPGCCALLVHAQEDDTSVIDTAVSALHGWVHRWSSEELQASAGRFND